MKDKLYKYEPNYCVSPGCVLREEMECRNTSVKEMADLLLIDEEYMIKLLDGEEILTNDIAERLNNVWEVSAQLWINLEHSYQKGKTEGKKVLK